MPSELLPIDSGEIIGLARDIRVQIKEVEKKKLVAESATTALSLAIGELDTLRAQFAQIVKPYLGK
jgi:hypothetical protein